MLHDEALLSKGYHRVAETARQVFPSDNHISVLLGLSIGESAAGAATAHHERSGTAGPWVGAQRDSGSDKQQGGAACSGLS